MVLHDSPMLEQHLPPLQVPLQQSVFKVHVAPEPLQHLPAVQ